MMEVIKISECVEITVTHTDPWNWEQHRSDRYDNLPKFITYIGGSNYSKLDNIISHIPYPIRSLRRDAKHFRKRYKYELKIWGLAWDDVQKIALQLSPLVYLSSVRRPSLLVRDESRTIIFGFLRNVCAENCSTILRR